ncbi:hypothetical protein POM88_052382 [Heracleum sosnowskyi]|uniref:Uncharacterized protein n=1 Tax=Heracleum sosnowskyi TaxID=360622 RepID=A0AAD8GRV6_9APIA|nr:hypothetical protein POM88_052382 [Heracleum sosnowskyi]
MSVHKFELNPLQDVCGIVHRYEPNQKPIYSTDVNGVMQDLEPLQTIQTHFGNKQIARFKIIDGSVSHKVHIWGPLNSNTETLYANHVERPMTIVLASMKLSVYKGVVQISNLPSSKIFINLPHEDVLRMRNSLQYGARKYYANPGNLPVCLATINSKVPDQNYSNFVNCCYAYLALWKCKNELVWKQKGMEVIDVVKSARTILKQWHSAQEYLFYKTFWRKKTMGQYLTESKKMARQPGSKWGYLPSLILA